MHAYTHTYTSAYTHTYTWAYFYWHAYAYMYMNVCVYTHTHIHKHTHTHTHTHTCTHMHTHTHRFPRSTLAARHKVPLRSPHVRQELRSPLSPLVPHCLKWPKKCRFHSRTRRAVCWNWYFCFFERETLSIDWLACLCVCLCACVAFLYVLLQLITAWFIASCTWYSAPPRTIAFRTVFDHAVVCFTPLLSLHSYVMLGVRTVHCRHSTGSCLAFSAWVSRSGLYCSSTPSFDFLITQHCTMVLTGCPSSTILPLLTTSLSISILKPTPISYWRKFFSLNTGVDCALHSLNRLLRV